MKVYFISDFHLGSPDYKNSRERERIIVSLLSEIKKEASDIYLLGDIFDFWFEYKKVVPKGFIRLLGKLAELSDFGIKIHLFPGNHDLWMKDYFVNELNATIYYDPLEIKIADKTFYLAHGDGLGPKDFGYKFINKIFKCKLCQYMFRWLHPDIGVKIAEISSLLSRSQDKRHPHTFFGEKEWLVMHARKILETKDIDYFIFAHRHIPVFYPLNSKSSYINLGDMIHNFSYAVFDGLELELKYYKP